MRFSFRADIQAPPEAEILVPLDGFRDYDAASAACRTWALRIGRPHLAFWACQQLLQELDSLDPGSGSGIRRRADDELLDRIYQGRQNPGDPPPF